MPQKWKQEEKSRRYKKQVRFVFLLLTFFLFLLILASGFRFYLGWREAEFKNYDRINIVLNGKQIILLSIVRNKTVDLISIPGEKKISLTRGFGEYPLNAIFKLGELEKKGNQLLEESIQNYFGLPVLGVISFKKDCNWLGERGKECIEQALWSSLKREAETDIFLVDLLDLWQQIKRTPNYNWQKYDLAKIQVYGANGEFDPKKLDLYFEKLFTDSKIVQEGLTVIVLNTTQITGLGNLASRILVNLGSRLINIGNAEPEREKTTMVARKEIYNSYTFKVLKKIFNAEAIEGEIEGGRADIGIYLGKDYWKMLNEKW